MNAFDVFGYFKNEHKDTAMPITLKDISWVDFFSRAEHSVFLCGGELRTSADKDIADKCVAILKEKFKSNPNFCVSIMGGSWLIEGGKAPKGDDPIINYTLQGLYSMAKDNPSYNIWFYYNPLNVAEATEVGYLHNVIIDEGEATQVAYIEYPHGCPGKNKHYENREWLYSQDSEFATDVIRIRDNFCSNLGIQRQSIIDAYQKVKEWTLRDFYKETKMWRYTKPFGFSLCLRLWLLGFTRLPKLMNQ